MKYYFIAGEASGDIHASNLVKELIRLDAEALIRGFGGELMEQAGMKLVKHYRNMAFMGVIPVLLNLTKIKHNFETCIQDLLNFDPDVLILVDYPGFNLKVAEFAKKRGIRVFYYISPKIWAWKSSRIKKIKAYVDEMFTILPFETDFYNKYGFSVNYVGNPVLDAVGDRAGNMPFDQFVYENNLSGKPVIALLPGSRLQEIRSLLPRMLKAASAFGSYQLVVTGAPNIPDEVYNEIIQGFDAVLLHGKTFDALRLAEVAILASGTVSLEAAVIGCPQIVCYRMAGGALFFKIGQKVLHIVWVSLVNIILQRDAVKELLQHHCSVGNIRIELHRILNDTNHRQQILESYEELRRVLGGPGASARAAALIIEKISY